MRGEQGPRPSEERGAAQDGVAPAASILAVKRAEAVEARQGFRIWVKFTDGEEGEVDLADLAGKGVFEAWKDREVFEAVFVGPAGSIAWPGDIEICPDATYLRLTGASPEDLFPGLEPSSANA